jgi:hypothetical protein
LKDLKRTYQELGISAFNAEKATILQLIDRFETDCAKPAVYDSRGRKISGYKSINPIKTYLKILREHFAVKELKNLTYNDLKMFRGKRLSTISTHTGAYLFPVAQKSAEPQLRYLLSRIELRCFPPTGAEHRPGDRTCGGVAESGDFILGTNRNLCLNSREEI